jgi:hypothetical protein
MNFNSRDVFAEINSHLIPELAAMLGIPGELREGMNLSPLREERTPSFSIYAGGTKFKDHGGDAQGDGVAFVMAALRCDHAGARDWWMERHGIDRIEGLLAQGGPASTPQPPKAIKWPGELSEGTAATWAAFAERRGISYRCTHTMVHAGILRFLRVDGVPCFAITDRSNRAAEIRRMDGRLFGSLKAFPLSGVDKSWLPGLACIAQAKPDAGIVITEGATDLPTAIDLYTAYRKSGGARSWVCAALLGAGCKTLASEAIPFVRSRRVRLVPDGDDKGDTMAATWKELLLALGCTVDVVKLPRGKDLSDVKGELQPEGLFR